MVFLPSSFASLTLVSRKIQKPACADLAARAYPQPLRIRSGTTVRKVRIWLNRDRALATGEKRRVRQFITRFSQSHWFLAVFEILTEPGSSKWRRKKWPRRPGEGGHLSDNRRVCATGSLANWPCNGVRKLKITPCPGLNDVHFIVIYSEIYNKWATGLKIWSKRLILRLF